MADTVTQLLLERAEDDNPAIIYDDKRWTWREYIAEASRWAAATITAADTTRPMHVGALLGNKIGRASCRERV